MIPQALLDTDVLSAVMRKHSKAVAQAQAYLAVHGQFTLSTITRYEVLRGLKAKGATTQLATLDRPCTATHIWLLTDEIIVRAAEIYSNLYQHGALISDVDFLIVASALVLD